MKTTSLFVYVFLLGLFFLQGIFTCFSSVRNDSLETIKIVGKVVDKKTGLPILGADVRVKGSSFGTKTFFDGSFQLLAQHGTPLYISYPNKDVEIVRVLRSQKYYNVELEDEAELIYRYVSQMPEFPGGEDAYNKFMEEHLKWNTLGYKSQVFVDMIVEKDGSLKIENVYNGTPQMNAEALRIMCLMPPWKPGMRRGKPVAVRMRHAISFPNKGPASLLIDFEELEGECDSMDEDGVYSIVEQMPEFPGGTTECMRFISNNFNYENEEVYGQGRAIVQFVVEKDGSITNPVLKWKTFPELDNEALRVIGLMPP